MRSNSVVAKNRTRELTVLFESYNVNEEWLAVRKQEIGDSEALIELVWFSEIDETRKQTIGHTKNYIKVVVEGAFPEIRITAFSFF